MTKVIPALIIKEKTLKRTKIISCSRFKFSLDNAGLNDTCEPRNVEAPEAQSLDKSANALCMCCVTLNVKCFK